MKMKKFWLQGGLIGLFMPLVLLGLFLVLNSFNIKFGRNPITVLLIFAIAFIERPIAIIGRSLGLPIETGRAAFILYDFTIFGYILTIMFWALLGAFFGWIIDKINSKIRRVNKL